MNSEYRDAGQSQLDVNFQVEINPNSSSIKLSLLVNESFELNRLIAAHPNATAAILSEVIEYRDREFDRCDEQTQRTAIRHPNILKDDALRLANKFPDDLFANPSIDLIASEHPDLFEDNYSLLEARGCPLVVLQRIADEGNRAEQASIARNPSLPLDLQNRLTPDYFYQLDLEALKKIASLQEDDVIRDCIDMYANVSRPFCVPRFLPFDRKSPEHRLADQVFCGFPFTSSEFPWPVEKLGNHMQPIAQINLADASGLLGVDLGSGLLQVWGGIESSNKVELQTRVIPDSALKQDLDWFYPERTPWLDKSYNFEGCAHSCIEQSDYSPFGVHCCRIDWHLAGRMFYPNIYTRVFDPQADDRVDHGLFDREDDIYCQLETVEDELDAACISRHWSFRQAWGKVPLVFLGG